MSFSRLLLLAANSKKYISGKGNDKLFILPSNTSGAHSTNRDPYEGEVILCFELDDPKNEEKRALISKSLDIKKEEKRCDGIIFYSKDGEDKKVICLVEMKSTAIQSADQQIKSTWDHLKDILKKECDPYCDKQFAKIQWKACFYQSGAAPDDCKSIEKQLKQCGFHGVDYFTPANKDAGPFLRGESTKDLSNRVKHKHRK